MHNYRTSEVWHSWVGTIIVNARIATVIQLRISVAALHCCMADSAYTQEDGRLKEALRDQLQRQDVVDNSRGVVDQQVIILRWSGNARRACMSARTETTLL